MNSKTCTRIIALTLFAALAIPVQLAAQGNQDGTKNLLHHHYKFIDMGTFGGPESYINGAMSLGAPNQINRHGTTVGSSATSIPSPPHSNFGFCGGLDGSVHFVFHAFRWQDDKMTDLGALPGYHNCSVATSINAAGEVAGDSEISVIDPVLGVREIRAVRWKNGKITNLGTFGGKFSVMTATNDQGQIAGSALNATPDPFSLLYDVLAGSSNGTQTRAFLWQNGSKQDLGTLDGPDAQAFGLNNHGQVTGISYTNSIPNSTTGLPTADPFLWEPKTGKMKDLGTLGGVWGSANVLNNKGQVIGTSSLAADPGACLAITANCHPFLWDARQNNGNLLDLTAQSGGLFVAANAINENGEIAGQGDFSGTSDAALWKNGMVMDLGRLAGHCSSEAFGINSRGQIIGLSVACDGSFHSFLWENGSMVNLNTLIPPNSSLYLIETVAINDRGEIVGDGLPSGCGDDGTCGHAYLLIPCDENHADVEGCDYSMVDAAAVIENPASLRQEPATSAPHNHPFGRRGLSHRYFGTPSGTLQIGENTSTLQMESSDDADSLLGTVTRTPPLLQETLGTLSGTRVAGRCVRGGGQCPPWTKCCPGLICVPASTRAFCEPSR
jgi:probable HAF family extracellular repeat protein